MDRVSEEKVNHIAHLAKLSIEGDELTKLTKDFNKLLDFVDQIKEVDTSDIERTVHPLDHADVRREDVPEDPISVDDIRKMSPKFEADFFVVPQVIESNDSKTS